MPRGSYQGHEPKKTKKPKQKLVSPAAIVTQISEPQRIPPKRKASSEEREDR